jgi:hypothetical protein
MKMEKNYTLSGNVFFEKTLIAFDRTYGDIEIFMSIERLNKRFLTCLLLERGRKIMRVGKYSFFGDRRQHCQIYFKRL